MKGIKLVNVDTSNAREERIGTCELCFGSMWCDNPVLTFENPDGDRVKIGGYGWDWGDYFEVEIDNYLNFSGWLAKKDIDWNEFKSFDFRDLLELTVEYDEEREN